MNDETFPNALPPGTRIGPVVLERPIGQGAWGIVYEGQHDIYGHVAVKEYFPSTYAARQSRGSVSSSAPQWQDAVRRGLERFAQEARALKTIRHENVVAVVDYIEEDGAALLVMDFVDGEPLSAALEAGKFRNPATVTALGATLVDTLQAIHAKNILHRDIAPDNIMIRADGSPVLIDFGGAAAAIATATRSTQNIVKDGYSPPEQYDTSANPAFPVGPWSDIYATAAVLYRLASGNDPAVSNARLLAAGARKGGDPMTPLGTLAPAGYPVEWLAAVDSGLALLPKDRPQSAAEWRKRFEPPVKHHGPSRVMMATTVASLAVALGTVGFVAAPSIRHWFLRPGPPVAASPSPKPTAVAHQKPPPPRRTARPVAVVTPRPAPPQPQQQIQQPQPVAVAPPTAPPAAHPKVTRFAVTPPAVVRGGQVRICYTLANSTHAELRPTGLALDKASDCIIQSPLATTNYTLIAYGKTGETVTGTARVAVRNAAPVPAPTATPTPLAPPPSVSITKLTSPVAAGAQSFLCYSSVNAQRVELQPDNVIMNHPTGCFKLAPPQTTVYSLIAYSASGASVSVPARIVVIAATPVPTPTPVAAINLSGTWSGNDNSTYSITQVGQFVTWSAHSNANLWRHTFKGTIKGSFVTGLFSDIPPPTNAKGFIVLRVVDPSHMALQSATSPFGTTAWSR